MLIPLRYKSGFLCSNQKLIKHNPVSFLCDLLLDIKKQELVQTFKKKSVQIQIPLQSGFLCSKLS